MSEARKESKRTQNRLRFHAFLREKARFFAGLRLEHNRYVPLSTVQSPVRGTKKKVVGHVNRSERFVSWGAVALLPPEVKIVSAPRRDGGLTTHQRKWRERRNVVRSHRIMERRVKREKKRLEKTREMSEVEWDFTGPRVVKKVKAEIVSRAEKALSQIERSKLRGTPEQQAKTRLIFAPPPEPPPTPGRAIPPPPELCTPGPAVPRPPRVGVFAAIRAARHAAMANPVRDPGDGSVYVPLRASASTPRAKKKKKV